MTVHVLQCHISISNDPETLPQNLQGSYTHMVNYSSKIVSLLNRDEINVLKLFEQSTKTHRYPVPELSFDCLCELLTLVDLHTMVILADVCKAWQAAARRIFQLKHRKPKIEIDNLDDLKKA